MSKAAVAAPPVRTDTAIRVMVVDDAVVFRGLVARWLADEPDMKVVGSHCNGHEALDNLSRVDPDVVVLDIEMPVLDGLATLPLLLARKPGLTVIIASTVTRRNAEVGLRALSLGAADYVSKPETNLATSGEFRRELTDKIRGLSRRRGSRLARVESPPLAVVEPAEAPTPFKLRPYSTFPPRAVVIGSSTGGPQALQVMVRELEPVLQRVPVLIAQHMPPTFTTILAEHLGRAAGRPAHEATDNERIAPGAIYVAPGGKHMRAVREGDTLRVALGDDPPVHFCRPAVDPLFESAAKVFGAGTLAVILTGMGVDGAAGAARVAACGGSVIAQDEATSVVWGMPGAAAQAGVCSGVLPLHGIAPQLVKLVAGGGA
jgi:two-component system chemotaxis response regulator CheB